MALPLILPWHSPPSHDTHRSWRVHALHHPPFPSSLCVRRAGRRSGKPGTGEAADDSGFQAAGGRKKKGSKKADPSMLGFSVESSRIMQGEIQYAEGA